LRVLFSRNSQLSAILRTLLRHSAVKSTDVQNGEKGWTGLVRHTTPAVSKVASILGSAALGVGSPAITALDGLGWYIPHCGTLASGCVGRSIPCPRYKKSSRHRRHSLPFDFLRNQQS